MNERDYYIFGQICLFIGVFYLFIGSFLIFLFDSLSYVNVFLMIFIFLNFFSMSIYFHYKRRKYEQEMIDEVKKYIGKGDGL